MVELEHVSFRYPNGDYILKNYSLKIHPNDRFCFYGPSGCGKTTLLRLIAGLEHVTEGIIKQKKDTRISFVFQENRLIPGLSVLENVQLVSDRSSALEMLLKLELTDAADRFPDELSGGMKRRVSLARALTNQFDLLILDEPFTGLDDEIRDKCISVINEVSSDKTVLLVTHDKLEAEKLNTRLIEI